MSNNTEKLDWSGALRSLTAWAVRSACHEWSVERWGQAVRDHITALEKRLSHIDKLATVGTVDAFMELSGDDKRRWFVTTGQRDSEQVKRIKELEAELQQAREREAATREAFARAERDRHEYLARIHAYNQRDHNEAWHWVGDGTDHLESMSRDMLVLIRAEDLRALADTDAAELMAAKDVALRELVHRMQARAEAANAEALERDAARMPDLADCLSTEATTLSDWARKLEALTTPDTGEQSGNAILQMEDHIRRMDAALQDCLHHLRSTSYHPVKDRLFEILEAVEYSTPDTGEQINEL